LGITIPSSLEEVGVLGVVTSIYKIANAYKDYTFTKSFENFTNQFPNLSDKQKMDFFERFSDKDIQNFGEQALLLLNKIETPLAAKMLGKAHYLLVINEIDQDVYLNYCYIIKQLNLYLLKNIKFIFNKYNETPESGGLYTTLFNLGLMQEAKQELHPGSIPPKAYTQSIFGWEFYERIILPFADEL